MRRAEEIVDEYLDHPEETDEPTCGPGPFSMANADTVTEQLKIAGFEEIALRRCDLPMKVGDDLDQAVEFGMALGRRGRSSASGATASTRSAPRSPPRSAPRSPSSSSPDGVFAPASTWIITARRPGGLTPAATNNLCAMADAAQSRIRSAPPGRRPRAAVPALGLPLTPLR